MQKLARHCRGQPERFEDVRDPKAGPTWREFF